MGFLCLQSIIIVGKCQFYFLFLFQCHRFKAHFVLAVQTQEIVDLQNYVHNLVAYFINKMGQAMFNSSLV